MYSAHTIPELDRISRLTGRTYDCVMLFFNAQPTWQSWENPWFIDHNDPAKNWSAWARAKGKNRRIIMTLNLLPKTEAVGDWRRSGASGAFAAHARALARNLVKAGLGDTVVRLSHEANGGFTPDDLGTTPEERRLWVRFWRVTAEAMNSVKDAHFVFDWTINARYEPVPLKSFYPGDDVVDIVGIDAYDAGVPPGRPRWPTLYSDPDGIGDVVRFARRHHKPLSIPEWGVAAVSSGQRSGGDDGAYVDQIARVVRNSRVAYQAYFFAHEWGQQLEHGPESLAAYRRHFGARGDSVGR